jgi:hypothetical protein
MNKEQQELLDEAYENFSNKVKGLNLYLEVNKDIVVVEGPVYNAHPRLSTQEEFINKCKTDTEFSEKWGLLIKERELEYSERYSIWFSNNFETGLEYNENTEPNFNDPYYEPTPTRLISITYKGQTIESYE